MIQINKKETIYNLQNAFKSILVVAVIASLMALAMIAVNEANDFFFPEKSLTNQHKIGVDNTK